MSLHTHQRPRRCRPLPQRSPPHAPPCFRAATRRQRAPGWRRLPAALHPCATPPTAGAASAGSPALPTGLRAQQRGEQGLGREPVCSAKLVQAVLANRSGRVAASSREWRQLPMLTLVGPASHGGQAGAQVHHRRLYALQGLPSGWVGHVQGRTAAPTAPRLAASKLQQAPRRCPSRMPDAYCLHATIHNSWPHGARGLSGPGNFCGRLQACQKHASSSPPGTARRLAPPRCRTT